jgi:hypothetical protein
MANLYKEQGKTGLVEFSGQIQDDFLRELRGKEAYKRYDEMRRNSPIVGALLLANEQAIRKVSWEFHCEEDEEDPRIELLEEAMANMSLSWNDHIIEALTMLPFGFSAFEIVYERKDGKILWRKFSPRGQDTVYQWKFDDSQGIEGFTQMSPPTYATTFLPIEKLLIYKTRVERGNPEGRSILRTAWIPYYYAKHIQQIEAIGVERDLAGMPVIKLPSGADVSESDASDLGKAQKIVRNVRNDEQAGITLPFGWEFELASTGGSRQFDTDAIIRRYEKNILLSTLAQFLMLGQDGAGSLALSKDQTDFFTMSVNAIADIIAETFTKYAIPRLLKLNGYDATGIKLEHTPAGDADVVGMADILQKVGGMITWSGEDELWLRQLIGLPERDPMELDAARQEQNTQKAAAAQAIKAQVDTSSDTPEDTSKDEAADDAMGVDYYAANAPDDAKRLRFERKWQKQIAAALLKQKNKVMKAVKKYI